MSKFTRFVIRAFLKRLTDSQAQRKADAQFIDEMKVTLADGKLTDEERHFLIDRHTELKASDKWRTIRTELFLAAIKGAAHDDEITPQAEADLSAIRDYLELDENLAEQGMKMIASYRAHREDRLRTEAALARQSAYLAQLKIGDVPPAVVSNMVVKRGEKPLLEVGATVKEVKVVGRKHHTGSRGTSIRLMKGVSFRVGASRGWSEPVHDLVTVGVGRLVITSHRVVFLGDQVSFSDSWDKIMNVEPMIDCLRYSVSNRQKPRLIAYDDRGKAEEVCAAMNGGIALFSALA